MSSILITGGCGYIGSALIPMLVEDDRVERVRVLDSLETGSPNALFGIFGNEKLEFTQGDVRNQADVGTAVGGMDTVIHLAAVTGASESKGARPGTFDVNVHGTRNLLEAIAEAEVGRFVFASSCSVYGGTEASDIDEHGCPKPLNPYAESKLKSEQDIEDWRSVEVTSTTALRLATLYGRAPGMRFNLVINKFVFRAFTGRTLQVHGDGSSWRPYLHVEDAACGVREAALDPETYADKLYNLGAAEGNLKIDEVAQMVRDEAGLGEIIYSPESDPGASYQVNFDRIDGTGWKPRWTVSRGIQDMLTGFRRGGRRAGFRREVKS